MKNTLFAILVIIAGYTYAATNDQQFETCIAIDNGSELVCTND